MTWRRVKVRSSRAGRLLGYVLRSLVARLVLLVVVFAAVPIVLYEQFREADESRQAILLGAIREKGILIGRAMTPILGRADSKEYPQLGDELARFAGGSASVRLLFRPANAADALGFYYVASAPAVATGDLAIERQRLVADGILHRLAQSCEGDFPLALRIDLPDGRTELLTSIAPVLTPAGCWALVSSNTLSELGDYTLGLPYWQFPEVRIAGTIYLALAAIVLFVFFDFWHSLKSFGRTARNIGTDAGGRFAEKNYIPELGVVAREFDRMVDTLQESALSLRRAAEDNAHAFKTPIGIIRQSLEPIRRRLASDDVRANRALSAINSSLDKLDGLIATARRLDRATADSLDPPRERVSLSNIARAIVSEHGQSLGTDGPRVSVDIADGLTVIGSAELLETVVENVFDNAVSFSPWRGVIHVHAKRDGRRARLLVEDEGPGVPPDRLNRIFDRYYSVRPMSGPGVNTSRNNFGIGLWIVRRNIEAMGGRVFAENRKPNGLRVVIELPAA